VIDAPSHPGGAAFPSWLRPRWVTVVVVAATISTTLPFVFGGRFLPLLDHPAHLAVEHIAAHIADPETRFAERYSAEPRLLPNIAWLVAANTLARPLAVVSDAPLERADRLLLVLLCALALPASLAFWLRAHGRDPSFAVIGAALAFHGTLFCGFVQWVSAVPLVFVALGARARAGASPARVWCALPLLSLALFFAHGFAVLLLVGIVAVEGALRLARASGWRERLGHLAADVLVTAPGLALFVAWIATRGRAAGGTGALLALVDAARDLLSHTKPLAESITTARINLLANSKLGHHVPLELVLVVAGVVLVVAALVRARPLTARERVRAVPSALVVGLALLACFFVLPDGVAKPVSWWGLRLRFLVPAALFLFCALAPSSSFMAVASRTRTAIRAAIVAIACATVVHHVLWMRDFRAFNDDEMAGYDDVLAHIPRAARVLPAFALDTRLFVIQPFGNQSSWAVVLRDAHVAQGLMNAPDMLVQWRRPFPRAGWGGARVVNDPAVLAREFDFVLARSPPAHRWTQFGQRAGQLELVVERGAFALWRVVR
jgi:hypothetical protein